MNDEPDAYQTYVLRLWRARCKGCWQWRTSIESPHTGERQWFPSLEQLLIFLRGRCRNQAPGLSDVPGPGVEMVEIRDVAERR
jgi:hypothetical protein